MKTKRIDKNYRPLEFMRSLEVVGSVPNNQMYDSGGDTYLPDYSLTPLILEAHVSVHDPHGIIPEGEVSSALVNIAWYELDGTGASPVAIATGSDYTVNGTQLLIKKNVSANTQLTIRFEADYTDSRVSQNNHVTLEKDIVCTHATTSPPVLDVDCPETFSYNPLRDVPLHVIKARLMHGIVLMTTGVSYVWEKKRSDNTWSAIGSDTHHDLGFALSADGSQLTQDMSLMGERLDLRVRATYPDKPTLSEGSPTKYFTLIRRVPKFEYDWGGVPEDIEPEVDTIYPKLVVNDHHGNLKNPTGYVGGSVVTVGTEQKAVSDLGDTEGLEDLSPLATISNDHISPYLGELKATWYRAAGVTAGNPTYEECGYGDKPDIGTEIINTNGMILGPEVVDRGCRKPVVSDDGNYQIVDDSGHIIVDR